MDNAKYNVLDICKYIINKSCNTGHPITNLKLQKLLYYVQANFLVELNRPCFKEEIEAWEYGPVVKKAYETYSCNGRTPLLREKPQITIPEEDTGYIDEILNQLYDVSAYTLVKMTHSEKPWIEAYARENKVISNEEIRSYFFPFKNKKSS